MASLVTLVELREAIAETLADNEKSYDLPAICVSLGLASGESSEAFSSKRVYVRSRILTKNQNELVELGNKVLERYPDANDLDNMIRLLKISGAGVEGHIKNLIFAADGPKPELVLSDALSNTIEIIENASYCLVYDLPIPTTGLLWTHIVEWWAKKNQLPFPDKQTEYNLFYRLQKSLASPPERLLFETYFKIFRGVLGDELPVLIPQVYLHFDPKTLKELHGQKRLPRQRMDFLLLFSNNQRIVVEIDGKQHYAEGDRASPKKYTETVSEDRRLRLLGYEIYRFSGFELDDTNGRNVVESFFRLLFARHNITYSC